MVVNTTTFAIKSLKIEKLDSFADPELGMWMRQRAQSKNVLGRDINAICWAMGSWYETAMRRAKFWLSLEDELGTEEGRKKSKRRYDKRRVQADDDEDDNESTVTVQKWTKRQVLPHMGRTEARLSNGRVELTVKWVIGFDWTGEAESNISASTRVPVSCKSYTTVLNIQC
jgi:hypothetical protein